MKVLILGKRSFIAQNFIKKYTGKIIFFYFDMYFHDDHKDFIKKISQYVNSKKINHIINFIGNNDNSLHPKKAQNILRDNFILPTTLVDLFKNKKINFTFFLSAEINKIEKNSENNLYALSKFLLQDSLRFIKKKNRISLIKIDSVYGPHDLNFNRLVPSLMLKILLSRNVKVNLKQQKKLIYVKDLLPVIFRTIKNKKLINIVDVTGKNINVTKLWKAININKKITKNDTFYNFFETLNWYKDNLSLLRKIKKKI